ncbi:MAG TPA: hypothetical protein VHG51_08725 [Longimicrobiaceae bacterium]|nr:hypothetical protein [Longimicrobiaceae bacterium]
MSSRKLACCVIAVLGLAACSGDAVAPAGPDAPARTVTAASTLTVTISGQYYIQPFDNCTWYASVSGGTPPYSYSWSDAGMEGTANGSEWVGYANGTGDYIVSVSVTDAVGRSGSATMRGTSTYSAYYCR